VRQPAAPDVVLGLEVVTHEGVLRRLDISERPAREPDQSDLGTPGRIDDVLVLLHAAIGIVAGDEQDSINTVQGPVKGIRVVVLAEPDRDAAGCQITRLSLVAYECGDLRSLAAPHQLTDDGGAELSGSAGHEDQDRGQSVSDARRRRGPA
jgi:hypothetical protein